MLPVGSLTNDVASGVGFIAASIAVCGFLLQALPTLTRKPEEEVRMAMVVGGLIGFFIAVLIITVGSW